ncbi:mechanosensitive ion channel family protein [Marinobacter sp. BGYM27]|uniref:mechanosensitive ion channel family protein n=1 Tax=Marinobacter sp. BGYM27 TaxID=2975597 RepID=UPI0021A85492|nr:mechanosensitive ion channel family protein [Marinobacter sp. BGYM27]MDG5498745.1 mechanosensitive ion channel family protein [Marinobacter sp. BGYM27]
MEQTPDKIDSWIQNFNLLSLEWRVALAIFAMVLLTALVAFIVSRIVYALERKFNRTNNLWDDAFLHALRKPAVGFVWLQGVYWAAEIAYKYSEAEVFKANDTILKLGLIWILVWVLLRFVKQAEGILASPAKMKQPMDYTTVLAVSKLARSAVVITAALIVMQTLGYSISGVLAFGGIGGIAIGFAAKDLLANFFGGLMVYLDRPFKVGDWVRSPDQEIEGTVEHIGWRLTTIRTFDKRPLYVPNAVFTSISVENPSRMTNRRISETIGIRYVDVGDMGSIVHDIREMLENHEEIDAQQTLIVNFLGFHESSLEIMIYSFTKTVEWVKYHAIKQDVLLQISEIIASYGAEIAFPTRTLHLADAVRLEKGGASNDAQESAENDSGEDDSRDSEDNNERQQEARTEKGGDESDSQDGEERPNYHDDGDKLSDYKAKTKANRTTYGDAD